MRDWGKRSVIEMLLRLNTEQLSHDMLPQILFFLPKNFVIFSFCRLDIESMTLSGPETTDHQCQVKCVFCECVCVFLFVCVCDSESGLSTNMWVFLLL